VSACSFRFTELTITDKGKKINVGPPKKSIGPLINAGLKLCAN
jgi:hypothetical protein